jgi:hypothetical protein
VTLNEQLVELPDVSLAVHVTVVVPLVKVEPEGGMQIGTIAPSQSSVAVAVNPTTAEHCPESAGLTILPGQLVTGGSFGVTLT